MISSFVRSAVASAVQSMFGPNIPSLSLNFLAGVMDPRVTFTRASTGSYYGSNGLLALSPVNLLTYSEQFDNAAWTKSNATITANAVTAPDGTLTADALVDTAANFAHTTYGTSLSLTADIVYTVSVYLKTGTLRYASVRGESVGSASTYPWITVDLQTGSVDANANVTSASATAVGNGWYRVVMTFVKFGTTVGSGNMVFSGSNVATAPGTASVLGNAYVGTGSTFYIWGAQLQTGSTATTYIPTTATASGAPRFDYDPAVIVQQNLLTYSEQFDNAAWPKNASGTGVTPVVTANYGAAPDGTATADRVQLNSGGAGNSALSQIIGSFIVGPTYSFSIWLKSLSGNVDVTLFLGDAVTNVTVTTSWQRFVYVNTPIAGNEVRFAKREIWGSGGAADLLAWGAQLNTGSTALPYLATTSSALTVTGVQPKGLLIEEQRTNLLTYSEQFDNAAWTDAAPGSTVTVSANSSVAPDGTTTADTLTPNVGGTNAMARQVRTLTASTTYAGSLYIKAGTSTQSRILIRDTTAGTNFADATFNWSSGVPSVAGGATGTWTVTPINNGWYRVAGVGTSGATASPLITFSVFPDSSVGTGTLLVWGAQLEAGAFATSYIPTVAAQVTRAADNAVMTGTNFSSWFNQTEGTVTVEADTVSGTVNAATFSVGSTASDIIRLFRQTDSQPVFQVVTGGVAQATIGLGAIWTVNSVVKQAAAYALNNFASSANSGTPGTDTSGTIPAVTQAVLGNAAGIGVLNGHIRTITYWPRRLSNGELQGVTS